MGERAVRAGLGRENGGAFINLGYQVNKNINYGKKIKDENQVLTGWRRKLNQSPSVYFDLRKKVISWVSISIVMLNVREKLKMLFLGIREKI